MTQEHPWGVGQPALIKLHGFAQIVHDVFGVPPVLVGSALRTKRPRDVDIRIELSTSDFIAHIGPVSDFGKPNTRWAALALAFSALGMQMIGRPIDFQVQPADIWMLYRDEPRLRLGADGGRR